MISIRQLQPSDAEMFRDFRLEALRASPGAFSSSFEREKDLPLSRWRELLAAPDGAVFGLFDGKAMIGLTAIYWDRDDSSGETAALAMSYVRPRARGSQPSSTAHVSHGVVRSQLCAASALVIARPTRPLVDLSSGTASF